MLCQNRAVETLRRGKEPDWSGRWSWALKDRWEMASWRAAWGPRSVLNAWSTDAHWVVVSNEAGARQGQANEDGLRGPYEGVWTFSMREYLCAWECVENSRCKEDGIWCTRVDSSLCTPGPDTWKSVWSEWSVTSRTQDKDTEITFWLGNLW